MFGQLEDTVTVQILRREGHNLELGKFLTYQFHPFKFGLLVSRNGIEIQGRSPNLTGDSFKTFMDLMKSAEVHHRHLASSPPGTTQTFLTEEQATEQVENPRMFNGPRLVQ